MHPDDRAILQQDNWKQSPEHGFADGSNHTRTRQHSEIGSIIRRFACGQKVVFTLRGAYRIEGTDDVRGYAEFVDMPVELVAHGERVTHGSTTPKLHKLHGGYDLPLACDTLIRYIEFKTIPTIEGAYLCEVGGFTRHPPFNPFGDLGAWRAEELKKTSVDGADLGIQLTIYPVPFPKYDEERDQWQK